MEDSPHRARLGLVVAALAVVYVVWGSTYLAIRVAVEELPPLSGMGSRFLAASLVLAVVLRLRGADLRVRPAELGGAALLGLMLPFLGNGFVAIGESLGTPSGVAALLVAGVPVLVTAYRVLAGERPRAWSVVGVVLGFAGLAWLVLGGHGAGDFRLGPAALILAASASWAFGSWVQPRLALPADPFVLTVHEMWTGGALMVLAGLVRGERLAPATYSADTWLAWGYLVLLGSVVAFTAYVWLLANAPIGLVATYAYVNPVVAVLLGALLLAEPVTPTVLAAGGVILLAVVLVITVERPRRTDDLPTLSPVPDQGQDQGQGQGQGTT